MRRQIGLIIVFIAGVILLSFNAVAGSDSGTSAGSIQPLEGTFVPNEILIGLRTDIVPNLPRENISPNQIGIASLDLLNQKYGVQLISPVFSQIDLEDPITVQNGLGGVYKLTFPQGTDIFAMLKEYQRDHAIDFAELNLIFELDEIPNDTDFNKQWALHNTGQTGGKLDADIDAPEAWNIEKGKPRVMIAIVDTGVDYNHPDLAGGRVRTDIDRDFVNNDDDAMDDHGHGTYCAGIAAANTNNAQGIAGVCWGCQILPVKVLDSGGKGTSETVAQGIQYAAQVGADIISMSLGYASNCGCSRTVANTINYAFDRGSLLVAASGNNEDKTRLSYPASSPRVLSVGASNHQDQEANFSNRSTALDIIAPGQDIYSLDLNDKYRLASGTSAAAPHVSGVAGLIWSAYPRLTNTQVWYILYHSADDFQIRTTSLDYLPQIGLEGQYLASVPHRVYLPFVIKYPSILLRSTLGRLNAYNALMFPGSVFSTVGQFPAPEDTCSSEPDCPAECGAEIVLSGEFSRANDLSILRAFRDDVLAQTSIGKYWITLYQRHRFETALILISDGQFRTQTRLALQYWLPLFQSLTYPDANANQQLILTAELAEFLEGVITGFIDRGSPQLKSDLTEVKEVLQVRNYVGWDVRDAWRELVTER